MSIEQYNIELQNSLSFEIEILRLRNHAKSEETHAPLNETGPPSVIITPNLWKACPRAVFHVRQLFGDPGKNVLNIQIVLE